MDFVRPVTGNRPLAGVGLPDAAVKALGVSWMRLVEAQVRGERVRCFSRVIRRR